MYQCPIYPTFDVRLLRTIQVIIVTHSHPPDRIGIRWIVPGLKVYYIPLATIASNATLPNFFTSLPYLRTILIRECIDILHGHASLSSMAHEGLFHSWHFGVRTVFTDHSLFALDDATGILTNKLLEAALRNVDAAICVSHTGCDHLRMLLFGDAEQNCSGERTRSFVPGFNLLRSMSFLMRSSQASSDPIQRHYLSNHVRITRDLMRSLTRFLC